MLPYNPKSSQSIVTFAKELKHKTLRGACDKGTVFKKIDGKGGFGIFLEKYYFKYTPNSDPRPDFPDAEPGGGLELKSTGLSSYNSKKGFKIKERLALKNINFNEVYKYSFLDSSLYKKAKGLLLVFYIWDNKIKPEDQLIRLVDAWSIPQEDMQFIVHDYNLINNKIKAGLAHELSGKDTTYLEAATTGEGHGSKTTQSFSQIKAPPRRYAFKGSYMNYILSNIVLEKYDKKEQSYFKECIKRYQNLKPIKRSKEKESLSLEGLIDSQLNKYYGCSEFEIAKELNVDYKLNKYNRPDKAFYARVVKKILSGYEEGIAELVKADITLKAVRIEENNMPKQHMSHPAFRFIDDVFKIEWEESKWSEIIQKKYLFVFFKIHKDGYYVLEKFLIWSMPQADIDECKKIWLKTKELISSGGVFNSFVYKKNGDLKLTKKGNPYKNNNFPKPGESEVCHVRPKGKDASDVFPLPVKDKKLKVMEYSKQCFWLNSSYVGNIYQHK